MKRVITSLGLAFVFVGTASAQLTTSGAAAAIDNIPPAPITNLIAADTPGEEGSSVTLSWSPSADDAVSFTTFGDAVVPRGGVRGYNIYRKVAQGQDEFLAAVAPGTGGYVDGSVVSGTTYVYSVRPFDLDNETDFAVEPGTPVDLARIIRAGGGGQATIVTRVKARMTFDVVLDLEDEAAVDAFKVDFIALVAQVLGINPSRVRVTAVTAGSIVVSFEIRDIAGIVGESVAKDALAQLKTLSTDAPDSFVSIGAVLGFIDETSTEVIVKVAPVDEDGLIILGWFTRGGNSVTFDDFFAFADHFGRKVGDATYDSGFDISPNGKIDFDDFFLFADDFGKTVANADEVRASEGL